MAIFLDGRDALDEAARAPLEALPTGFAENFAAALDLRRSELQSMSEANALYGRFEARAETYHRLTGRRLPNPLNARPGDRPQISAYVTGELEEARAAHPEIAGDLPTDEEIWRDVIASARTVRERQERIAARQTFLGGVGEVLGDVSGAVTDPPVLATLPFGAAWSAGILRTALVEAGLGAASEAIVQPGVYAFQQKLGNAYGLADVAGNIALAGAGAGAVGAGIKIAANLARPTAKALLAAYERTFGEGGAPRAATPDEQDAAAVLRRDVEMREQSPFSREQADAVAEHVERYSRALEAVRRGELPDLPPPRSPAAPSKPTAPAAEGAIAPEPSPAASATPPARTMPEGVVALDPDDIAVDARTFQFKAGGDEAGVTERLQGVETFDPRLAGMALVYEAQDGRLFIVDGHQRLALARRAKAAGQPDVRINALVLREEDGISPAQARVIAAMKNIAEGTGSAVDAAKVLRETGGLGIPLPPRSALVRDARGLARLSDEAFGLVVNEVVPPQQAAIVGRLTPDPEQQLAVLKVLAKVRPENAAQAEAVARDVLAAGLVRGTQASLFGDETIAESLFAERAKVLDLAARIARQERSTFLTLVEREEAIAEAGNVLARAANLERIEESGRMLESLSRLATRKGPISDALTEAARGLREGRTVRQAARQFLDAVREAEARAADAAADNGMPGLFAPAPPSAEARIAGEQTARIAGTPEIDDALSAEVERILARGEVAVPVGQRLTDDGALEVVTRPARELLAELDDEARAIDEFAACGGIGR